MEAAGAQAFNNVDTHLAPFVKKDNLPYEEVKQLMQQLIFNLNNPSRWGCSTPFTNFTFDLKCNKDMRNKKAIVGGKEQEFTYGDCQKEIDMINKAFMEVMEEGDADQQVFTFPIPTYNITKDFDWDSEITDRLFKMASKYGIPYFSNYVNSDMSPSDLLSMCPMTPDTKVLVRSPQKGMRICNISEIYKNNDLKQTEYQTWTKEGWCDCKLIRIPKTKVLKITLSNGVELKFGINHMQPIMGGEILPTSELKIGMWLPFNKKAFGTNLGDFELGFAVGAYAGDGSRDNNAIIYSLCDNERDKPTAERLVKFWENLGFNTNDTYSNRGVNFIRINENPYDVIKRYIAGDNALDKKLTKHTFNASIEFKEGLIEGLNATDGSQYNKRIYTSSNQLKYDITYVLASLGRKYARTYIDTRDNRLGKNPNYRIDHPQKIDNYKNLYKADKNYHYYKIVDIEEYNYTGDYLYCFEVYNKNMQFMLANGLITRNCRLRLSLKELRNRGGGYFGSGNLTGSCGIVSLNMPRLGLNAWDKEDFYENLDNLLDKAKEALDIKRREINKMHEKGFMPYMKRFLPDGFKNHFSTFGVVGMNECCINLIDKDITTPEGQEFAKEVLDHINERLSKYQEESKDMILYNLEATPAEGTAYRFAKHDKEKYFTIKTANDDPDAEPYYTNSSHLPVGFSDDIWETLELQDELQSKYTSGTVLHLYLGEAIENYKAAKDLVRKIFTDYKLPYLSLTPSFSTCIEHGYIKGEVNECPKCGKDTLIWSRVTGYLRPIQNYNEGKKQEAKDRIKYKIKEGDDM